MCLSRVSELQTDSRLFYVHSWTGELSTFFHAAPPLGTTGGMLCDDVGLGKSLQELSTTPMRGMCTNTL